MDAIDSAVIFDVQRFCLHDGPGIRTAVYFKGCPLRCLWCQNHESHKSLPETAFYHERCRGCFRCEEVCPHGAISRDERRILFEKCSNCGLCAEACPYQAVRTIGRAWKTGDLTDELLKDKEFFDESGGGVTLTGGEPFLHRSFLEILLPRLKKNGIHVTVETCGQFHLAAVEKLLPCIDLIYFDLKHIDSETHRNLTGYGNEEILANFTALSGSFPNLQARMPVVPGMNDDEENIAATAEFLSRARHRTIHCLPYNRLGESKRTRIDTPQKPLGIDSQKPRDLIPVKKGFEQRGIHVRIYD